MGSFIRYSCPGGDIWCPDFCMPPVVMGEEMQFLPSPPSSQSTESDVSNSEYCSIFSFPNAGYVQCKWKKCSNWFPSVDDLATHISFNHTDPGLHGLFYCQWDGCVRGNRAFNARYKMLVHIRTHTNEKPHLCYICSKKFSRAENLKIHARSHTGEKPYVCPAPGCGKAYSNSSDRYKHSRTHETDKPYMCKVPGCTKKYTDPSSLRKHIRMNRHFPWMETTEKEKNSELWENEHQLPFCAPEQEIPLDLTIKTSH